MKNQTSLLRWAGLFALAFVVFVSLGQQTVGATETKRVVKKEGRSDVVIIDALAADGALELPPVVFLHDQHTKALKDKDCTTCHKPLKDGDGTQLSFTFMGAAEVSGKDLKNLFHENCIGCHATMAKAGQKTGPLEASCRSCHSLDLAKDADRQTMGFDKLLHYKHIASSAIPATGGDTNCATCHHVYDAATQSRVWGKNQEDSCRACHKTPEKQAVALKKNPDAADENGMLSRRPTLDVAAHQSCINCHLAVTARKQPDLKSGPADCAGCHSTAAQVSLAVEGAKNNTLVPRLERAQPDAVLMMPVRETNATVKTSMSPVSFNHKFHETVLADCRTCHHQKIDSCSSCHSIGGKEEGNFIPLAEAMHKSTAQQSCVGCHNQVKEVPSCAGCHTSLPKGMTKDSCQTCHSAPVGISGEAAENGSLFDKSKEERTALAEATVAQRERSRAVTFDQVDIPETVTIGILSNEYEPSVLPHRKIVNTLMARQSENRLASAFHSDKATLCQSCHHNSPASKTPPPCVSCHATAVSSSDVDSRPSLKAAYHLQCMTCHTRMEQKPAENQCADCHKPRGK